LDGTMFSLARALFSPGSAEDRSSLFVWLIDRMARSDSSRACAGSSTTQDRLLARDYREPAWCLPPSGESRHPNFAFFEAQYPAHPDKRINRHIGTMSCLPGLTTYHGTS
jgi:hypothetical protein